MGIPLDTNTSAINVTEEYKERMRAAAYQGRSNDESKIVEELLSSSLSELDDLLEWIFVERQGSRIVRIKAGLALLARNTEKSKQAIERPINSDDSNDRIIALKVLENSPTQNDPDSQAPQMKQVQTEPHKNPLGIIRDIAISFVVLSIPPVIWMFVTHNFTLQMFIQSIVYLIQFSTFVIAGLLPFHFSSQGQENGTIYLLNLLPLVLVGVPTFFMSWKEFGVKKAIRATWFTLVIVVFLMELAALALMSLFSRSGP